VLLEGSPGVGKSSLVIALAAITGNKLVRINLSEQTEISDLIGSDLPTSGGDSMTFEWHDGPLLAAMKAGNWVLMDELNLATQSVLEGLNACLDHRAEIFIPELNKTFTVSSKETKIFATQNPPREGGERKNLPKSFLNRFVKVHLADYTQEDIRLICAWRFERHLSQTTIDRAVTMVAQINAAVNKQRLFGSHGNPWQFNLRDLLRLCSGLSGCETPELVHRFAKLILVQRFRTLDDQSAATAITDQVIGLTNSGGGEITGFEMNDHEFKVGLASAPRNSCQGTKVQCDLEREDYPVLESLLMCIQNNWLSIVVGDGKREDLSRFVQLLAGILGHQLHCLTLSSATDTSELLGGFEQTSAEIVSSSVQDEVRRLISKELEAEREPRRQILLSELKLQMQDPNGLVETIKTYKKVTRVPTTETYLNDALSKVEACCQSNRVGFEWIDSVLVQAMRHGDWVLLADANLCNPSVLDRLNSLMEESRSLAIGEQGCRDGQVPEVTAHPNFRLFLTIDPRDGELSPAMRNRGVEIFVKPQSTAAKIDIISGQELTRHGEAFIIYRQFQLMRDFAQWMSDRALIAFLCVNFHDWRSRRQVCKMHFGGQFEHPAAKYLESCSGQQPSEVKVLSILESEMLTKVTGSFSWTVQRKEMIKQIWRLLCSLFSSINESVKDRNALCTQSDWEKLCTFTVFLERVCSIMADSGRSDDSAIHFIAIVWKTIQADVSSISQMADIVATIGDLLVSAINPFEHLTISFGQNLLPPVRAGESANIENVQQRKISLQQVYSQCWGQVRTVHEILHASQGRRQHWPKTILELLPALFQGFIYSIKRQVALIQPTKDLKMEDDDDDDDDSSIFACADVIGLDNVSLVEELVLHRRVLSLLQADLGQEGHNAVEAQITSYLKIALEICRKNPVKMTECKNVLQCLNVLQSTLKTKKAALVKGLGQISVEHEAFAKRVLSKCLTSIDDNLCIENLNEFNRKLLTPRAAQVLDRLNEGLISTGLLTFHIACERGDVDVAEQMLIQVDLKQAQVKQLKNDIMAHDTCRLLFPITDESDLPAPDPNTVQKTRWDQCAALATEAKDLEEKRPERHQDESYKELMSEVGQVQKSFLSVETVFQLVSDLKKAGTSSSLQAASIAKTEAWLTSVTAFMRNIPARFSSYGDVWRPLLSGCANVVLGLLKLRSEYSLDWRTEEMAKFDEMRHLVSLSHLDKLQVNSLYKHDSLTQLNVQKEEDHLQIYVEIADLVSGECLDNSEIGLVYQIFHDAVTTSKSVLKDAHLKVLDIEQIVSKALQFTTEKFEITSEDDEDANPFIVDLLKMLKTCLSRPVLESPERFLVPLERISTMITEWNKNAVTHQLIPHRDLESMLIQRRKASHEWSCIENRIKQHLEAGVKTCLQSLMPFLNKSEKSTQALVIPFTLFCHNSFVGDFNERLKCFKKIVELLAQDEPQAAEHLRSVLAYFEPFAANVEDKVAKAKKELRMKFEVQKKSNKRLYEEVNIVNNFKAAAAIYRETFTKFEQIVLKPALNHFSNGVQMQIVAAQSDTVMISIDDPSLISEDIPVPKAAFCKVVNTCIATITEQRNDNVIRKLESWTGDIEDLCSELAGKVEKKLSFHVAKTKSSGMMDNLKTLGFSRFLGGKLDLQVLRVLQQIRMSSGDDQSLVRPLFLALFNQEKLSSSLLLPTKAQSKAFTLCKVGEDFVSHGLLISLKLCQRLSRDNQRLQPAIKTVNSLIMLENDADQSYQGASYELVTMSRKALAMVRYFRSLKSGELGPDLTMLNIIEEVSCDIYDNAVGPPDIEKITSWQKIIGTAKTSHLHTLNELIERIAASLCRIKVKLTSIQSQFKDADSKMQTKVNEVIDTEAKKRFLAIQSVVKRAKAVNQNWPFLQLADEIVDWLKILDIEAFYLNMTTVQSVLQALNAKGLNVNLTTLKVNSIVFKAYLSLCQIVFQFGTSLYVQNASYLQICAKTLKIMLEYEYAAGDDDQDDDKGQSQNEGKPQDGCGLGDGQGGDATTNDVESEDIFDTAEKPQNPEDQEQNDADGEDDNKDDEDKKEEDGFEIDGDVKDENPQPPEKEDGDDGENDEGSDKEEEEEKEEGMEAEEGTADEVLDEEVWNADDSNEDKEEAGDGERKQDKENEATNDDGNEEDKKKDDDCDQPPPVPEDEDKRTRKDEDQIPEVEADMADEIHGENEPPEPEDLDMGDNGSMFGDDDDNMDDADADEENPDEDVRLADFEDEVRDEAAQDDQDQKKDVTTAAADSNAEADGDEPQAAPDPLENKDDGQGDLPRDKNLEVKTNAIEGEIMESGAVEADKDENMPEANVDKEHKDDDDDQEGIMDDDQTKEAKRLPITSNPEDEDEDESKPTGLEQEFAHAKDKHLDKDNLEKAMDLMDIEKKPKAKKDQKEEPPEDSQNQKEPTTLDLSKLKDAIKVDTQTVERNTDTIFGRTNEVPVAISQDYEMVPIDDLVNLDDSSTTSEDVKRWLSLCHTTTELTQNLTEQLRLILETTKATRFRGDYKSGKRINMRKVIPFIASNYRKDKIWLRRTKPSKRDYNVIVAVDDSTSMRVHNVNHLVDQSLVILCQTLSSLEVGKLGIVKFGQETEIVQPLQVEPITIYWA
jgi:hypothetical protein